MMELLAPNGKPSNLTAEQYKLVRTSEFKAWFGDWENDPKNSSEVIDEETKEPLVVYHGSKVIFNKFEITDNYNTRQYRNHLFWFSKNKETAKSPLYVNYDNYSKEYLEIKELIINLFIESIQNLKSISNLSEVELFKKISDFYHYYDDNLSFNENIILIVSELENQKANVGGQEFLNDYIRLKNLLSIIYSFNKLENDIIIGYFNNKKDIDNKKTNNPLNILSINDNLIFNKIQEHINLLKDKTKTRYEVESKVLDSLFQNNFIERRNNIENKFKNFPISSSSKIYEVFLNVRHLYKMEIEEYYLNVSDYEDKYYLQYEFNRTIGGTEYNDYDGGVIYDIYDGGLELTDVYAVYDSKQIKLADGTNTTFDENNPDIRFKGGGRTIAQTPAPKKDQIKGSDKNKEGSAKDLTSAKKIKFADDVLEKIQNSVDKHNKKHSDKKITIDSAKAVVRRGMGAYSSTHRPTISGGNENSRVAWGLARLNAFLFKIVNGKSKSGKYSQDNDLIEELGYKVQKYADGGDIQAYKEAMGISEFKEGGETKPKKVYVSIEFKHDMEGQYPNYFFNYEEKPFEELKNGVLEGLVGVSTSTSNIAEWFYQKNCLVVMDYDRFMSLNETETINYNDANQLMKNNLLLLRRLWSNVSRYGEQKNVYAQTIIKLGEKIYPEIILKMNISEGQKYYELYRISQFLNPSITSAFSRWIELNSIKIESPSDLTNAIIDFNKLYDGYLGNGFDNPILNFDELLPLVEKGIINASKVFENEQEIVLKNRKLIIPKQSQLFFIRKDEVGRLRSSNQFDLIEKYKLKYLYKVHFVDRQDLEKYRISWNKKYSEKKQKEYAKNIQDLELKKEQVIHQLFGYFINKSLNSFKEQYEKENISEYSESKMFYDRESDDYQEIYWYGIILIQFIVNKYIEIIQRNWKRFIESKDVKDLNLYSFSNFFGEVKYELQEFFDKNKDELEKINNWKEIRGNGYLNLWGIEYLLKKSVDDYENLPEWIDYKELSKMYLDKMGGEIYRYYDKKDLPLISQYKNGGKTDEPTEFWGTEAGGVLVYCSTTERYLILLRSEWVLEPNTWGVISGKLDDDETNIEDAVLREVEEEVGYKLNNLIPSFIFEETNFKFHNFVAIINEEFIPELNWENTDYKWVTLNDMPDNLHFGLKLLIQKEDLQKLVEKNNTMNKNQNPKDTITMDIPLLIRFSELMREEIKTDVALHEVVENLLEIKDKGVLTMSDYDSIVGNVTGTEEDVEQVIQPEEEKMAEGGKVQSIHSAKGDIKINLDENWYSDDTKVQLVPVSELIKFREFDRKVSPKYNQENSKDNINHLKYMFQKEGVKSPLIIEYSPKENSVLIIEGNHRLNSAIDLGMEFLPARVVLKKYGTYSPEKLKSTMKVSGVTADESGYISSDLKPSQVGIEGTMPIYADGGIIEGRLHSECGDDGCGRKFQVGENGHVIEAERDEAVIVADAFDDNENYTIKGTPSEVASAINVIGGGKNFDRGATIIKKGQELEIPQLKKQATDTDVADVIDSGSIIINRRSMADEKEYEVTGTPKQIASAINSINGNGVIIEEGAEIKEN